MKNQLVAGMLSLLVSAAFGQTTSAQRDIWSPHIHIKDQNVVLVPWGSGGISETTETAADGAYSLRISTHNYFQGGFVKFNTPVDLTQNATDANSLLSFTIRTAESVVISNQTPGAPGGGGGGGEGGVLRKGGGGAPTPGAAGAPGAPGGKLGGGLQPGGAVPGAGGRGKFGGGGDEGGGGAPAQAGATPGASTNPVTTLRTVRVVITTTDKKKSEAYLPLPMGEANKAWRSVAVPLQAVNGFSKSNKIIESIGFSGDTTSTYYIGDIRIVSDPTPITGEIRSPRGELNLALGDTVRFIGVGYGGATILRYTWDFDNSDGIQEDAIGQVVDHRFRKPGKFVVTLTIKDLYGLKAPYSTTFNVTVNP